MLICYHINRFPCTHLQYCMISFSACDIIACCTYVIYMIASQERIYAEVDNFDRLIKHFLMMYKLAVCTKKLQMILISWKLNLEVIHKLYSPQQLFITTYHIVISCYPSLVLLYSYIASSQL